MSSQGDEAAKKRALRALYNAGRKLLELCREEIPRKAATPEEEEALRDRRTAILSECKDLLNTVDPRLAPLEYIAVENAISALRAHDNQEPVVNNILYFHGAVEAVHGGPREINLGGKRIHNKPSAKDAALRAAAIVLWEEFPDDRDKLVADAKRILKIKSRKALAKMVDNFNQRHDRDLKQLISPISIHIKFATELVKEHGFRRLEQFVGFPTQTP
jgi:hypothetical protein